MTNNSSVRLIDYEPSATSSIWSHVMLMQNFQFPWRILTVSVLLSSIVGAIVVSLIPSQWKRIIVGLIVVISIVSTTSMWQPKAYKTYDEAFFTGIYKGTTDTGESSPIWSIRFMEFSPSVPIEIATGSATITPLKRTTTTRNYQVTAIEKTRLVENTLYFPGWHVYVDGTDTAIQFQDAQWRGRITFWIEPGNHMIRVAFQNTKLRQIADAVSGISIFIVIILSFVAIVLPTRPIKGERKLKRKK